MSMSWLVQLSGDTSDLASLAQSFTGSDIRITHDDQDYILTSDSFACCVDAADVHREAERIIDALNGAACISPGTMQPIRVGAVLGSRADGKHDIFCFMEPVRLRHRVLPVSVKVTHPDGTVKESHPADHLKQWLSLALANEAVAKVFRICANNELGSVDLYRVLEIIAEDVGGLASIESKGWAKESLMRLLKRTANLERHGVQKNQPPPNPIPKSKARALMVEIIHKWLREKTSGSTSE